MQARYFVTYISGLMFSAGARLQFIGSQQVQLDEEGGPATGLSGAGRNLRGHLRPLRGAVCVP